MKGKIIAAVVVALLGAAGVGLQLNPCVVDSPFCQAHLEKQGALKDAAEPYYISFQTQWLAQTAHILYPAYAMGQGQEGSVVLRLRVSEDGKLLEKSVAQSSGFALLDKAALDAANAFVFNPAGFGNVLFPYEKDFKVTFKLAQE
jgi:TonB family protein